MKNQNLNKLINDINQSMSNKKATKKKPSFGFKNEKELEEEITSIMDGACLEVYKMLDRTHVLDDVKKQLGKNLLAAMCGAEISKADFGFSMMDSGAIVVSCKANIRADNLTPKKLKENLNKLIK